MPRKAAAALRDPSALPAAIIKQLEPCTAGGIRPATVWDDWLALVLACLEQEPAQAPALATTGRPAPDPPAVATLFARLRGRYPDRATWDHFAHAFALLRGTPPIVQDTLGRVYMAWAYPSRHLGQFFTPFEVAALLAQMTYDPGLLTTHIAAAAAPHPEAQAAVAAGAGLTGAAADAWTITCVLPWVFTRIKPVTICDPACGSGVLLLAGAAVYPRWATQLGLVEGYGVDLDATCVLMAQIQCRLYGLRAAILCADSLATPPADLDARLAAARPPRDRAAIQAVLTWAATQVAALPDPYPARHEAIQQALWMAHCGATAPLDAAPADQAA